MQPVRMAGAALCAVVALSTMAEGAVISVPAGGDLQGALNRAQPGDTILLQAGAEFVGNFTLPVKSGTTPITVRTSTPDSMLPGPGVRIQPSHAPLLARLRSSNAIAVIRTAAGAHHWRLEYLEVGPTRGGYGDIIQIGDGSAAQDTIDRIPHHIVLSHLYVHGDPLLGQKRGIALNAADVEIRDSHVSDCKAVNMESQAIAGWNGPGPYLIENNFLEGAAENILFGGADPKIAGMVPTGIAIRRNYLSKPDAWRDAIIATPGAPSAEPADGALPPGTYAYRVVARRPIGSGNMGRSAASAEAAVTLAAGGGVALAWPPVPDATEYRVYGRTSGSQGMYWRVTGTSFVDTGAAGTSEAVPDSEGSVWVVKNLLELKNARDVTIEYNVLENNWKAGQPGYAIVLTPRNSEGSCTWCVVERVTLQFNVIRNTAAGINLLGYDSPEASGQAANITIRQNLFAGVAKAVNGGNGWFFQIGDQPRNIIVDHNTIDHDGTSLVYVYGGTSSSVRPVYGFTFTNNAARHNQYGIAGAFYPYGIDIIAAFFPGSSVRGNLLAGGDGSRYPAGNLFLASFDDQFVNVPAGDFRLQPGSPLRGAATDGADVGVNMATLLLAVAGVESGQPQAGSSTPTPPVAPRNLRVVR